MKVLVTGATGFLGFRLLKYLKQRDYQPFATGRNPEMIEAIRHLDIPVKPGSIQDSDFVQQLVQGMDAVVHTAGLSSPWGTYETFYQTNVIGTRQVVDACLAAGVPRLVHISTPSIYVANRDCVNVRESDPLPEHFANAYAETKYLAEKEVLRGQEAGLETVMLRPRALIGEGDTVIVPRLLRAQREGRLRIIGRGNNEVDMTAVENVCYAIELGLKAQGEALGEAYNITNGKPVKLWETLAEVFSRLDLKLSQQKLPFVVAYTLAGALEIAAKAQPGQPEPTLTRYSVVMLARSQTLNIDKARRLLGYEPQQSTAEAMEEFVRWWKQKNWMA